MVKTSVNPRYKRQYGNRCSQGDVLMLSTSVRTFDKRIWLNHRNGYFVCLSETNYGTMKPEIVTLAAIYSDIQTVESVDRVIARKSKLEQPLRFLEKPYLIGTRRK